MGSIIAYPRPFRFVNENWAQILCFIVIHRVVPYDCRNTNLFYFFTFFNRLVTGTNSCPDYLTARTSPFRSHNFSFLSEPSLFAIFSMAATNRHHDHPQTSPQRDSSAQKPDSSSSKPTSTFPSRPMLHPTFWDRHVANGGTDSLSFSYESNHDNTCDAAKEETIYTYWMQVLLPALLSSIPILLHRIASDSKDFLTQGVNKLLPQSSAWRESAADFWDDHMASSLRVPETLLKHFDMNGDGILSPDELLNVTDWMQRVASQRPTFWKWFANEWPMMDWKIGLFLWQTFGGMLVLLTLLSIVPGRLHGYAARILRWPILGLTYFLVAVELVVYGVIRLAVRLAEFLIARPKHRALRRQMMQATSYAEWYAYASQLDRSQKRNTWLKNLNHDHARYNWTFIKELIVDLKAARKAEDSLWAMAVLENCTRKNVGGIMSEDLFSYSNTGIPKFIVTEFIEEVSKTLHWMTDEAASLSVNSGLDKQTSVEQYAETLKTEVRKEKDKLWRHLVSIFDSKSDDGSDDDENGDKIKQKDYFSEKKRIEKMVEQQKTGTLQIATNREEEEGLQSQVRRTAAQALPSVHREQVLQLLRRARTSYGRTALCLSGGAMMGLYHW